MWNSKQNGLQYMKKIGNFYDFLNENTELSGKYSFFNYLDVVDSLELNFFKNNYHRKLYEDYIYFFSTEVIKNNIEVLNKLKFKRSLSKSHQIIKELGHNKISFFFGIKTNKILRYGFIDNLSHKSYVTGQFSITTNYFKSLYKNKCVSLIISSLSTFSIDKYNKMEKIKEEFKSFYKNKESSKIDIDGDKVINYINKKLFKQEDFNKNMPMQVFDEWISRKKWKKNITSYFVDEEDEKFLKFIIVVN